MRAALRTATITAGATLVLALPLATAAADVRAGGTTSTASTSTASTEPKADNDAVSALEAGGDGQSSGPTSDAGGVYPDGGIRHTYKSTTKGAPVTVDAKLTAQYRANGGEWQDIDTVADLQDEPVTTLVVKEARARLVND
jgi:hypothetical protein